MSQESHLTEQALRKKRRKGPGQPREEAEQEHLLRRKKPGVRPARPFISRQTSLSLQFLPFSTHKLLSKEIVVANMLKKYEIDPTSHPSG